MDRRVRVYLPMGEMLPGMAYLVRRLLENTSNESFLRAGFLERVPEEQLLMNPIEAIVASSPRKQLRSAACVFANEAAERLQSRGGSLRDGGSVGGDRSATRRFVLARCRRARDRNRRDHCIRQPVAPDPDRRPRRAGDRRSTRGTAVASAKAASPMWRATPPRERAISAPRRAGHASPRFELAAWEVYETAKQWREADADVAEAIDYCDYYAAEMLRLAEPQHRDVPGEENEYFYEPRGVTVTIAPWNFPLAILCGMTTAALVSGNTVVMKPAEQSPVIAAKLMEVFDEAGFPPGVVNFLPGIGEEVGPVLVNHPDVATIAFTGSRAVGLAIQEQASRTPSGQIHVKRVITEMGGKNAAIVDETADLDEAVHGVVASAFGYSGQKCSACSRAVVIDAVYEPFLSRLVEATRSLKVGPAEDPGAFVGPVIDAEARDRILAAIAKGKQKATLAYGGELPAGLAEEGFYVAPHVFADVPPTLRSRRRRSSARCSR
jgi:RHH-type proline utilization regulon transcriptional repressor/proline dehydrogenase/delta 1-pyrroline-5-carboxylate dehydrogenase